MSEMYVSLIFSVGQRKKKYRGYHYPKNDKGQKKVQRFFFVPVGFKIYPLGFIFLLQVF
jgi:hypothetical protein